MKGLYLPSLLLDCQANISEQKDHELKGKQEEGKEVETNCEKHNNNTLLDEGYDCFTGKRK